MSVSVIICSAGKGERAGFSKNKLLQPIQGEIALVKTLRAFDLPYVDQIIVAHSPADETEIQTLCAPFQRIQFIKGGATRFETVKNALTAVTGEIVLIHDGARPFVPETAIENCIRSVKRYGSGICAIPATDTIAQANGEREIVAVPDRATLYQIQTPQGFYTKDIIRAYALAQARAQEKTYTDDSSVYADFIAKPKLCDGAKENVKLTYATDFKSAMPVERVGFGVDTHAFGKAQDYITLCGIKIPSESGLVAHSDGDVAVHALMDGMLSAVGLRDIGYYFPDTDEKWRGANSMEMLSEVKRLVEKEGYKVRNVSIAIQAENPRLAKYISAMVESISSALEIESTATGITAGTNEKLGYVGEGKGITVYAYVLLK